jgi:hypothetical protein
MKKLLVVGIILLFIGVSVSTSTGKIDTVKTIMNDGSLLGIVNDTSGNPIEGALVRVHFHETFEEDYSDEDGYYHVTYIPICYCLKNATCSKDGYKTEWVLLSIVENTTHDFILTSGNQAPDAPFITGPQEGNPGDPLTFTFSAEDPDGDDVRIHIDWGDGITDTTYYVQSGVDVEVEHTWSEDGTYDLTAYAEDEHGAIGPECTFLKYVGTNVIFTHVTELYGTPDEPQYRPLPGVTVKIKRVPFFWNIWRGLTDETGTTEKAKVSPVSSYKVIVSKNNYLVYGSISHSIVHTHITPYTHHVNFTMVKDDSPFVQQYNSQSSQQYSPSVESKSVETSIRIHRARSMIPFTLRLTKRESDEVGRIFDFLKVRLDTAVTGEEIDEIYDDAVESLYELGMFPRMTLKEAKQLVKGKSKSHSENIGTAEENYDCSIAGQTTYTYSWDLKNSLNVDRWFLNRILSFLRMYGIADNYRYYLGKMNSICFGEYWSGYPYWYPSEGWVHTKGTNGVVKWEGEFYGGTKDTEWLGGWVYEYQTWTFIGVKKFEGLFIDRWFQQPPCYLGNAYQVKIRYGQPPPP